MPLISPEARNFSMPWTEAGRAREKLSTWNCLPNLGLTSQSPLSFRTSPGDRGGKDPTMVTGFASSGGEPADGIAVVGIVEDDLFDRAFQLFHGLCVPLF